MKRIFLFFNLLVCQFVFSQVKFEAKTDKQIYGINERIMLSFILQGDADNFEEPVFSPNFDVVGSSNSISSNTTLINGRYKKEVTRTINFFLAPKKMGKLTIGEAKIEINNKIYKSSPISLTITKAVPVPQPQRPGAPQLVSSAGEGVFLVAEISNSNPFVGQPIAIVYKLYFDPRVELSNIRQTANPAYNGFWSQNQDIKGPKPAIRKFKGKDYAMVEWRKVLLYPLESGRKTLDPLKLNMDMHIPVNRGMFFETEPKVVVAGANSINVRELPQTNIPSSFSGAVGNFVFEAKPSKTTIKQGESIDIELSVSGTGNLKLFELPKLVLPSAIEVFDPVHKEQVNVPMSGMNGRILDTYTIVPQSVGKFKINAISFAYFDLMSKSYKTISTKEFEIEVKEGDGTSNAIVNNSGTLDLNKKVFQNISSETQFSSLEKPKFFDSGWFYVLGLTPLCFIPLLFVFKQKREAYFADEFGTKIRTNQKLARKYLAKAKKEIGNKVSFYLALEKALHNFLKAKIHVETSEMSKDNIESILLSKNVSSETTNNFIELMKACEFARYAPSTNEDMQNDFEKAAVLLSDLEKQLKK